MSPAHIAADPLVKGLFEAGLECRLRDSYLLIDNIAYATPAKTVGRGTLVTPLIFSGSQLNPPDNHQVWFAGGTPSYANGTPLSAILHSVPQMQLWDDFKPEHHLSNLPDGVQSFTTYTDKMNHYLRIIGDQARQLDPGVTHATRLSAYTPSAEGDSVFVYPDSASARAGIEAVAQKNRGQRIGLIGVGGTGAYILDQVAKTHVQEIHLYDDDIFENHSAFRAPGAASKEAIEQASCKVAYYAEIYSRMHKGIVAHRTRITQENIHLLSDLDFVFLSIDDAQARRVICRALVTMKKPFIDVGMDVQVRPDCLGLYATCRTTLATPDQNAHLEALLPTSQDEQQALYDSNIQISDLNMMNAALAVMKWKQWRGLYLDHYQPLQLTFSTYTSTLARLMTNEVPEACESTI